MQSCNAILEGIIEQDFLLLSRQLFSLHVPPEHRRQIVLGAREVHLY